MMYCSENLRKQGWVKTFPCMRLGNTLTLELKPADEAGHPPGISGVEIIPDNGEPISSFGIETLRPLL